MKKPYAVIGVILLLSLLPVSLINPVSASPNWWTTYWQEYKSYPRDNPYQIYTTTSVSDKWGYGIWHMDVALVVDIYQYKDDFWRDVVNIAVSVYVKSYAYYGLRPIPASDVYIMIEKNTGGVLEHHYVNIVKEASPPGYTQGEGLYQGSLMGSTYDNRKYWALEALAFGVGLFYEPIGIAYGLIDLASAWAPKGGYYKDVHADDVKGWSRWENPGYDFGSANPVRQYGFNCFRWFQDLVKPNPNYYGIDIYASIGAVDPFWIDDFDTPPVMLRINRRSGGWGCPILSVYDGEGYVEEGSLDIHASKDKVVHHKLTVEPEEVKGKYHLRLTEPDLPDSHSYIDQVKLYALDDEGSPWECPLIRAIHSEDGNVKSELLFSDDIRRDTLPYEYIDLTFLAEPVSMNVEGFIFVIEGYNYK